MAQSTMLFIIAVGPHGFPGASQIMCKYLVELARAGCDVHYVGTEIPFYCRFIEAGSLSFHIIPNMQAGAIGDGKAVRSADVLLPDRLTDEIVRIALARRGSFKILLWGTYLLPYGRAALDAKRILAQMGIGCGLWLTPSGSDIWEIGSLLDHVVGACLADPQVDRIVTYSRNFVAEIAAMFDRELAIDVVGPIVDCSRFFPLAAADRQARRREYGFADDAFVVTSHSNMRPVKAPDDVLRVCRGLAKIVHRPIVLILMGPQIDVGAHPTDSLTIVQAGVISSVERWLQVSDVELNCSKQDSFNLSLAEAMASGVPCATTDVVGIAEDLRRSGAGILFPVETDAIDLSTRYIGVVPLIADLATDEDRRQKIGMLGRAYCCEEWSRARIIPRLLELAFGETKIKAAEPFD